MTEEITKELPELLKKHTCTLKRASLDDTGKEYLCESMIKVVDFDKIPKEYARGKGWRGVPKSNDALYVDVRGKWHFIEFKNGKVDKHDIYRKIYDSIIMLIELRIIPGFDFVREKINYILVYNPTKNDRIPKSPSRDQSYDYFFKLAKQEKQLFEVEKFEKYLFNETHTYTKSLFEEKFVHPMEQEEGVLYEGLQM